jgi:hypothetical protein
VTAVRACFVVDSSGTAAEVMLSEAVSEAYDIMTAAGVTPQRAADMAATAERSGKDPVAFAEHFTRLRRAMP